jgi:hypothetical protein
MLHGCILKNENMPFFTIAGLSADDLVQRYFLVKNILFPEISRACLPDMLRIAVFGGVLAGIYGVLHDQITYLISPEYFTRLKFLQFHYADFGLPPRIFVAEIGFLAAWWVGFFAAWFIARLTVPAFPRAAAIRHSIRGCLIVLAFALAASIAGYVCGLLHGSDYSAWSGYASKLHLLDLPAFVRVAYIHNASYLGGLIGLIVAILYVRKLRTTRFPAGVDA